MNDRLLFLSCYFPPAGGVNVQRALSLVRYLPENGFDVTVLTARSAVPVLDSNLVKLIPKEVEVHRTWTLEPPFRLRKRLWGRLNTKGSTRQGTPSFAARAKSLLSNRVKKLICPDPQILWYPFAVRRASQLVRDRQIQTVLVTAPPFSAFLIANELKKRFPHLFVIADVRDELASFVRSFVFQGDEYVSARAMQIERETVECCDRIVAVTSACREAMKRRYPEQPDQKFALIPNGYDPAAFADFRSRSHQSNKLVFTYTGTLYVSASPKAFLDAVDGLPELRGNIETRFIGRVAEEFDRTMFEHRGSSVVLHDFVPQQDAFRFLEETDILLLPWIDRLNIPGKFFEYLATGKPILALCYPDSEVARVMKETGAGWCVDIESPGAIRQTVSEIQALSGRYPHPPSKEAIRRYERPCLAAEYAQLIRDAARARLDAEPRIVLQNSQDRAGLAQPGVV